MASKSSSSSSSASSVSASAAPSSSSTGKKTYKCPPIYLNLLLLNKDELVGNKVVEKTGLHSGGLLARAAAFTANKFVTDEKIITNLAENLIDGVSKSIKELGITAEIAIKFKQGCLVVIRIQIDEIDIMQLIVTAKGKEFAENFNGLLTAAATLGMEETVHTKVHEKVYGSIGDGMKTKFSTMIPQKMAEKGVFVECQACSHTEQAEIFFELYDRLQKM
jgi:hypothetical protein